jgi:hypothetical protein
MSSKAMSISWLQEKEELLAAVEQARLAAESSGQASRK